MKIIRKFISLLYREELVFLSVRFSFLTSSSQHINHAVGFPRLPWVFALPFDFYIFFATHSGASVWEIAWNNNVRHWRGREPGSPCRWCCLFVHIDWWLSARVPDLRRREKFKLPGTQPFTHGLIFNGNALTQTRRMLALIK